MSVKVMTEVFSRYPNGGGEMLLALALADHANDSGASIHPSIERLAEKTRQSTRTVQRQLRAMEQSGWLIPTSHNNGGRNQTNHYQISPDWLNGDNLSPPEKGDIDDTKGRHPRHKRVTRVSPARNRQEPSGTVKKKHAKKKPKSKLTAADLQTDHDIPANLASEFLQIRNDKRLTLTPTAWERLCSEFGKAGLSITDGLTLCCENSWAGFKASWNWQNGENNGNNDTGRSGGKSKISATERYWRQREKELAAESCH